MQNGETENLRGSPDAGTALGNGPYEPQECVACGQKPWHPHPGAFSVPLRSLHHTLSFCPLRPRGQATSVSFSWFPSWQWSLQGELVVGGGLYTKAVPALGETEAPLSQEQPKGGEG